METKPLQQELKELEDAQDKSKSYLESQHMTKREANKVKKHISKLQNKINAINQRIRPTKTTE